MIETQLKTPKLDVITTRGGDTGDTSLAGGKRVPKSSPIIRAIGAVDSANSHIGLLWAHPMIWSMLDFAWVATTMQHMFDIGADLAISDKNKRVITDSYLEFYENQNKIMADRLPPLTSFVLPTGSEESAQAHIVRTMIRAAEIEVVCASNDDNLSNPTERISVNPNVIRLLNRMSDTFFLLARCLNAYGKGDVLWVPQQKG